MAKSRVLFIRRDDDDRAVAILELVSPGNKSNKKRFDAFLTKTLSVLNSGRNLLLIDLWPTTRRDPNGAHGAINHEIGDAPYSAPPDRPLTLASYEAGGPPIAYVEPVAVGDVLPDMPLFLERGWYVSVPLEATYLAAFGGIAARLREKVTRRG